MKKTTMTVISVICVLVLVLAAGCGTIDDVADTADDAADTATDTADDAVDDAADDAADAVDDAMPVKIGVAMGAISSTFCEGLRDGAAAKVEELGGEAIIVVSDGDATLQATQIEDLVAKGCQAIICFANDTDAIVASAKYCDDNGVIFAEASRISTDMTYIDLALGFDNAQQATICGEAILDGAAAVGYEELKCIEFVGSLTDQNAIERQDYFEEFAAANDIEIVGTVLTEWDAELAYGRFKDAITACGGDYNCIYAASDFLYATILSVLSETGNWVLQGEEGYKVITGIDGAPDAVEKIRTGYVYMVANTDVMLLGAQTAAMVYDMVMNGTTYEGDDKTIIIDAQTITADNCDDPTIWGNNY